LVCCERLRVGERRLCSSSWPARQSWVAHRRVIARSRDSPCRSSRATAELRFIDPEGLMGRGGMPSAPGSVSPVYGLRFGGGGADAPESLPQGLVNFTAGFGDGVSSLGHSEFGQRWESIDGQVDECSLTYWTGVGAGVVVNIIGFRRGAELPLGRNWRIAPWGNRTGHPTGRFPHYHPRGIGRGSGETLPGQSIKRHRPWDSRGTDKSWWDRL
jgi:hypothetical protein